MVNRSNLVDYFDTFGIGWNKLLDELNMSTPQNYPPYNLIKLKDDSFLLEIALAGFNKEDIKIELNDRKLDIFGEKKVEELGKEYIHQGIAARKFRRQFVLADYVIVTNASFDDGILRVECKRELPPEKKPLEIPIGSSLLLEGKKEK